jgi:unsaturated chondroitin disaccharide hydrolase
MRYLIKATIITCLVPLLMQSQQLRPDKKLLRIVDTSLHVAAQQYHLLMKDLPADSFPVAFNPATGKTSLGASSSWVSGFYPAGLLYLYAALNDTVLYQEALKKLKPLEKEKNNKDTHDLGFMMYCPFGNAWQIKNDPYYKEVIITSARSLAGRFSSKTGCIRSWNSEPSSFYVIIDNMMNLELLFAATRFTGDSSFYRIAVTHANTTMKNHFRPDYSSYHLLNYDPNTDNIKRKQTVQGAADESAWARGQAWGLYGFVTMYRETKDPVYLDQANHIAGFILSHLPADKITYWDHDAPGIPATERDASAAAITCSALIELAGFNKGLVAKEYLKVAETILRGLSSPTYRSAVGQNGGFVLMHGVGNHPKNSEVDVPIIYTDYYYIESLIRYRNLAK